MRQSVVGQQTPAPDIMQFAGLGLLNALCLLGGMALGWLLDSVLHTLPLFMMVGLILGVLAGAMATRTELKRWS